jgi:hypothetical protein
MVSPANLDDLSHTELKNLVVALFEQVAELRRTIAAQADEIARLKGGPRRPNIKPSGMEKATEPKPDTPAGEGGGKRGSTKSKLTIHEEKTVKAAPRPGRASRATPASWFRIWWSVRMSPISAVSAGRRRMASW